MTPQTLRSSIDLGTNTCLMLVATGDHPLEIVADFATVVRLGEGVDKNRRFSNAAMQRTLDCLIRYASELKQLGGDPRQTIAVATSGSRDSANRDSFFEEVQRCTGFQFRILSGADEARLTHRGGLLPGMNPSRTAVIDIGGGSTELRLDSGGMSLDMGSVRYTERYLQPPASHPDSPVTDEQFWQLQAQIDNTILNSPLIEWRKNGTPIGTNDKSNEMQLCAVAGTATTLAAWFLGLDHFDAKKIDGLMLSRGDLHRQVEELKWRTVRERELLPGIEPGRADVLLAGAVILWRTLELLDFAQVTVSTRGLRFGVLIESAF